jgi:hypothetical protein
MRDQTPVDVVVMIDSDTVYMERVEAWEVEHTNWWRAIRNFDEREAYVHDGSVEYW